MDENLLSIFPEHIRKEFNSYFFGNSVQEIRVKIEKPIIFILYNKEIVTKHITTKEELNYILQRISNFSLYAYEEEVKQGFITIAGGHRVGLAGECVMENSKIKTIKNISSLNIRICREIIGACKEVIRFIYTDSKVNNTLIISPPKCGKTTILRDIVRNLSEKGKRISVVDERSEIAGCYKGAPQMNVGIRTDVLDNCAKSQGMIMAIRSLSPDVLICDEIGSKEDIEALIMAFNSGVSVITTLHGFDIDDLFNRKVFDELLNNKILDRVIVLSNKDKVGGIKRVYEMDKEEGRKCSRLL